MDICDLKYTRKFFLGYLPGVDIDITSEQWWFRAKHLDLINDDLTTKEHSTFIQPKYSTRLGWEWTSKPKTLFHLLYANEGLLFEELPERDGLDVFLQTWYIN